jgi:hypothetical protein
VITVDFRGNEFCKSRSLMSWPALASLPPSPRAAQEFTDKGGPGRPAGALFSGGRTRLTISASTPARVVSASAGTLVDEITGDATTGFNPTASVVLNLTKLVDQVQNELTHCKYPWIIN